MAYVVSKTDGNLAAVVDDGTINTDTSIKLVGKGYPGYASVIAGDLVALLENFSSQIAPAKPITGQVWFNKSASQLQVFDGLAFKPVNNVRYAAAAPAMSVNGDFWYNTSTQQMLFRRNEAWQLVAPPYTSSQLRSELVVETLNEQNGNPHTVVSLFCGGKRTVIISSDAQFQPIPALAGYPVVMPGLNVADVTLIASAKLNGHALIADTADGLSPTPDATYMHANSDTSTIGTVSVVNDGGITIGGNLDFTISASASTVTQRAVTPKTLVLSGYGGATIGLSPSSATVQISATSVDVSGSVTASALAAPTIGVGTSSIATTGTDLRLGANGGLNLTLNSDGTATFAGAATFAQGLTATTDSQFGANILVPTLPTADAHAANKRYVDQVFLNSNLPRFTIIMWYGTAITVPAGWAICDGTNGTPNLIDRFVMGAGGSAVVGQTGGTNTLGGNTQNSGSHTHTGTVDPDGVHNHTGFTLGHGLTAGEVANHQHNYSDLYGLKDDANPGVYDRNGVRIEKYTGWNSDGDADSGAGIFRDWQTDATGNSDPHVHGISTSPAHTHSFASLGAGAHSHAMLGDNRPAFTAVYYIMRL